jgi:hypothetical protein
LRISKANFSSDCCPFQSVVTAPPVAQPPPQHRSPHHDAADAPHPSASGGISPDQIAKLQSELDIVSMNMTILSEMLTELKPNQEAPGDYRLMIDLVATCKEMQARVVDLIGKINNDEFTAELLRINDELNNLFLRHQRYEKNRDPKTASERPSAILGAAMGEKIDGKQEELGFDVKFQACQRRATPRKIR